MRGGFPQSGGMASAFTSMNRNKRSLAVDLQKDEGKKIARQLILSADVALENFRPGVMDLLGLGFGAFRENHPKLVYASINGVGSSGPYANRRSMTPSYRSGFTALRVDGKPDGQPMRQNPPPRRPSSQPCEPSAVAKDSALRSRCLTLHYRFCGLTR